MRTGTIPIDELSGGFDLQSTLESGQSYLWRRADGHTYEAAAPHGGSAWYHTAVDPRNVDDALLAGEDPVAVRVRQTDGRLEWAASAEVEPLLWHLLRLDDDLAAIRARSPEDGLIADAYDAFRGMRIVADPPFPTLVSFICSAQMRVARIFEMVTAQAREFGRTVEFPGPDGTERTYHAFPTPERLADATEADLRELGLGYRAPYVRRTAEMVADGEDHPADARGLPYEEAREYLTRFVGVGEKVADCVLLFSLGFLEAVPLDTWIHTAIEEYYPDCARGNYADTSRAIRERFGGDVAGYVQTYVFFYLRTR
jgi:N-glycosylase/DNA lyase